MAVPWLDILDTVIAVADIARIVTGERGHDEKATERQAPPAVAAAVAGSLDAPLAAIASALRDAAVRDARRMEVEREQKAAERQRADRALRLELVRQAGDREIGRMRTLAGVAVAAWIGTLVWSTRLIGVGVGARFLLGFGWLFLLGAIAASFVAQSRAAAAVDVLASGDDVRDGAIRSGTSGILALWLMILGLVLAGVAALLA